MKPTCLIIEYESVAAQGLAEDLRALDLFTLQGIANDTATALEHWQRRPVDLLLLDIEMPGNSGLQLLRHFPGKPMVILVTAYQQYALHGYDLGVVDYLPKPAPPDRLKAACEKALEEQLPRELFAQTHKSFIVGKQHIRQVNANTVVLPGAEVPLSRRYRAGFLQQLQLTKDLSPVRG